MKLSAIKKLDGKIWICHGDASKVMEEGDVLIELPEDCELPNQKYRECWAEKDGEIIVDLAMAKAQKLEEVRKARDEKLAESDKAWMIAMSKGKPQDAINAQKQALRDLPDQAEKDLKKLKKIETIDAYEPEWP